MGLSEFAGIAPTLAAVFHSFAHWAAPAAIDALWQGAAVAAGLAICLRLMPRVSASHRFAAWMAGFGVAAGLPTLPFLVRLAAGFAGVGAEKGSPEVGGAAHAWLQPLMVDARWSLAIAALWLAISAYRVAGLAVHAMRLHGLWKSARVVEGEIASVAAMRLPDLRGVEVCTTKELDRPSVIGFFAPRILIPEWLLKRLTSQELEQLILHEAEHLSRHDDWTNLLQKLCIAVFPLNPVLLWIDRRLSKEREMACDEGVVQVTGAPRAYAACLASLAERELQNKGLESRMARTEALSLGAFERRPELVHRVHSLLLGGQRLSPVAGRALVSVVGCGLIFGAAELARCPQVVDFVPQQSVVPAVAQTEAADAMRAEYAVAGPDQGFRALNAVAIVPARRAETRHAAREHQGSVHAAKTPSLLAAGVDPRSENLKPEAPATDPAPVTQSQEWMVVAWQVQTAVRTQDFRAQNVADYEDGARNQPGRTAPAADNRPAANQMAVTKMFVGVYRASQTAQSASQNTTDKAAAAGKTVQPAAAVMDLKTLQIRQAAVPFGDGWLVIQL